MSKSDDIPQDIWDAAQAALYDATDEIDVSHIKIARWEAALVPIAHALMAERERCAKIADTTAGTCERLASKCEDDQVAEIRAYTGLAELAERIAKAIRS